MKIIQMLCPSSKYNIKCPYSMEAEGICIHNTANDAPAVNEIKYMISNNKETSFHFAVDDIQAVQGLPLDRNGWHASDGGNGRGNRKTIAIEICYSKSGGDRWLKALDNAAELTAELLIDHGWDISRVSKHQDYGNHKHCPHRILDEYGWDNFLNLIKSKMGKSTETETKTDESVNSGKTVVTLAREVIAGRWGNGAQRKANLTAAGYDYSEIQGAVNDICAGKSVADRVATCTKSSPAPAPAPTPVQPATPAKKSNDEIAKEVMAGKWGNGADRKARLEAAGYNYAAIQNIVNGLAGKPTQTTTPARKSNEAIAREVIAGKWGNGNQRKQRLTAAGYNYAAIQRLVNRMI